MQVADRLRSARAQFEAAGIETAALDARLLLQAAAGLSGADIVADPQRRLTSAQSDMFEAWCLRRLDREPVARILGRRSFMDLDLEITPATLDPRPDTETLVEATLGLLRAEGRDGASLQIADLGTGSGAILIALLQALPRAQGLGIDISNEAIAVAYRNATHHGVASRARFSRRSWLDGLSDSFDVVVSNPPYIPSADIAGLAREVVDFDPRAALDGGPDGLSAYRQIFLAAPQHLRDGGWLVLEVGAGQSDAVALLMGQASDGTSPAQVQRFRDLQGHERCVAKQHRTLGAIEKKIGIFPQKR